MSVQSEVSRLNAAKSDLASAITAKGVTVPAEAKLDDYAALVEQIQAGGGTYNIIHMMSGGIIGTASAGEIVNQSVGERIRGITANTSGQSIPYTGDDSTYTYTFVMPSDDVTMM